MKRSRHMITCLKMKLRNFFTKNPMTAHSQPNLEKMQRRFGYKRMPNISKIFKRITSLLTLPNFGTKPHRKQRQKSGQKSKRKFGWNFRQLTRKEN